MKNKKNGIRREKNGWIYISVSGSPYDRGYAYGKLVAKDMKQVRNILDFVIYTDYGVKWNFFNNLSNFDFIFRTKIFFNKF